MKDMESCELPMEKVRASVEAPKPPAPPAPSRSWGHWQEGWIEPARPNVDLGRLLRNSVSEGQEGQGPEPPEWYSDALQLVLLPGKGRGLVASRSVEAGELLMVSRALFLAPADQIQQLAVSWILEATPRKKQQFYSLFDGTNGHLLPSLDLYRPGRDEEPAPGRLPDRLHPDRIYKILALNGFQADKFHAASATDPGRAKELLRPNEEEPGTAVSGLWAVPSLMNHACVPSTLTVPLSRATLAFVAASQLHTSVA
ncbi:unnamed protein product [Symbiodinium sp. KB8]|nr:unnamed protein product [Symbiodinium sp. KB8]